MATSASGIYSETLQSIVDAKLAELQRKRTAFEDSRTALLHKASRKSTDIEKLKALVDGVKSVFGIRSSAGRIVSGSSKYPELEQKLANLERFLDQPQYDPSISSEMLEQWEQDLQQQLNVQSARFEYASLYAQLVTEWLSAEKKIDVKREPTDDTEMSESFEELESKQMIEAREKWLADVCEPLHTDVPAIQSYLNNLFGVNSENKQTVQAFNALKRKIASFQNEMSLPNQFDESVLKWVIKGLLRTDLLTEAKRNVLRDFLPNSIILNELADVLNLRISSIETWSWGDRVPLEQKRKIQGHIAIVMHEDLLQAILLQYIGVKWSVFLRQALADYIAFGGVWRYRSQDIPQEDLKRREYFLGRQETGGSLQAKRLGLWRSSYFMCQLPRSESQLDEMDEGEVEADLQEEQQAPQMMQQAPRMQLAQKAYRTSAPASQAPQAAQVQMHQQQLMVMQQANKKRKAMGRPAGHRHDSDEGNPDWYSGIKRPKNPTESRQVLLHLLSTEVLLNNHLYGNLTAFRGQFERWNPLLPHSTILAVLTHLGVSNRWMKFFQTFLEAPLSFTDEETLHRRRRGVPGSHALSDLLGETVLFCLDLKVNHATKGDRLWRVHDDFWFWSPNHGTAQTAWASIQQFSDLMGLKLDFGKSGSARIGTQSGEVSDQLPQGRIRWGFLALDSSSGRFEIDQGMVDRHVTELHRQLDAKTGSVFSWIEVWNAYANTFFSTNFGKAANCFGRQHIDDVLTTLNRAQQKLFDGSSQVSSVVEYLKHTLASRFGITNVPEGYVFFPSALGGLELRNPFVILLQLRDNVEKNPQSTMKKFTDEEQEQYKLARQRFEKDQVSKNGRAYPQFVPASKDTFFSFEEYTRYREEFTTNGTNDLQSVFTDLLGRPNEEAITASSDIMTALNLMDTGGVVGQEGKCGINGNWWSMEAYWKWVLGIYGPGILKKFGGLNIVDNGVLPIGMVSLLRSQGVSWTG